LSAFVVASRTDETGSIKELCSTHIVGEVIGISIASGIQIEIRMGIGSGMDEVGSEVGEYSLE
jgi:hypothetical protein